jgi:hypothetical protein
MSVVVVISQHLLNVFVQLANKKGLKKMWEVPKVIYKSVVERFVHFMNISVRPDELSHITNSVALVW